MLYLSIALVFIFVSEPVAATQPSADACELQILTAAKGQFGDGFSESVSITRDYVVVGADHFALNGVGAAYVYRRSGTNWLQEQELNQPPGSGSFDFFGLSVAVMEHTIMVGCPADDIAQPDSGSVHVFRYDGTSWQRTQILTAADAATGDDFGFSVALHGDTAVVGVPHADIGFPSAGAAYVFRFDKAFWVQEAKLQASDAMGLESFGWSVSIDGEVVLVGAPFDDDNGENSGSAFVFRRQEGVWTEEQKLAPLDQGSDDKFGRAVSLSSDVALVGRYLHDEGATNSGSAYVFRYNGNSWAQEQELRASDASFGDHFGSAVAVNGGIAVVGAEADDDACGGTILCNSGSAYVFRFDGTLWTQQGKLIASDTNADHAFASSLYSTVAISDYLVAIGAPGNDVPGPGAGAAYVFAVDGDCNDTNVVDACEIHDGLSVDANDNLIPDECEPVYGDVLPPGGNLVLDVDDILRVLDSFIDPLSFPEGDLEPCTPDADVDVDDITAVLNAFIGFPACVWSNGMWVPK